MGHDRVGGRGLLPGESPELDRSWGNHHNTFSMTSYRRPSSARLVRRVLLPAFVALACGLVALGGWGSLYAADDPGYRGRRLIDVLRELQQQGLDLIFSSAVVGEDLRVSVETTASEPRAVLNEILPPLGLKVEDGPSGSILILPLSPHVGQLRGRVLSLSGGNPVAGAVLRLPDTDHGTTSDTDGSFEIRQIPVGTYEMTVEAPGFSTATFTRVRVTPDADAELTVELRAQPTFVTEVVVTPNRHSVVRQEQASHHTVTNEEAVLAPTIGGDVTRVVELLPGVAAPDSSAAFHVRGSVAQDVSLVLDGLELYDPYHLQSFQSPFSVIDATVVDKIDFFGGGFTADFGDRHGGFVEISTFVPEQPGRGEIELGTLNSRVSYRGTTPNGSGAWLVSARVWYPDALGNATELGSGENIDPRFGDLYAKAAFNIAPRHRLSAHGLLVYDQLTFDEVGEEINESVDSSTKNGYAWLRALSAWSTSVTSESVLSGGRIDRSRNGIAEQDERVIVNDDRIVDFFGLKHDSTWQISNAHALKAGAEVRRLNAEYRYSNEHPEDPPSSTSTQLDPDGTSFGVYVAHRARASSEFATELGVRWDRQTYTDDSQISPRFNAVWRPDARSEMRLALGRFSQSQRIHELQVEDGETEFGRAEISKQAEMSYEHGFRTGLRIRLDAYYRELSDLRPRYENLFEPIELFPETSPDRVRVAPEEARLRGVELLVRGDANRPFFWWASYAMSSAEDVIDGRDVPRSWDQTHAVRSLIGYRRNERWSVSLSSSVHTGWPTTPVSAEVTTLPDGSTEIEAVPGERNSDRFPTYARLDLKARRSFSLSRGRLWLTLEVVNLTDRKNACCLNDVFFVPQPDGTIDARRQFDYWLGITPSFSVLWEF
jgi:outer membrane cobalamin receptor